MSSALKGVIWIYRNIYDTHGHGTEQAGWFSYIVCILTF